MAEKLSQEIQERIVSLYLEKDLTGPQVAERLGIGETTVYRYLSRAGITPAHLLKLRARRGRYRFSPEVEKEISTLYIEGQSSGILAKHYGCDLKTVINIVKRYGGTIRDPGTGIISVAKSDFDEVVRLYIEEGLSQSEIARRFETNPKTVGCILRRHGIEITNRHAKRERHGNWKGGLHRQGPYVYTLLSLDSPFQSMTQVGGYVAEHRLVMAQHLGRSLHRHETVHHINGDKVDNRIENLQLRIGKHGKGMVYVCADCGSHNIVPAELD